MHRGRSLPTYCHLTVSLSLRMPTALSSLPVLATAILVLATGRTWRARRAWVESVSLACLIFLSAFALGFLPAVLFTPTLFLAAMPCTWLAFAYAEWRFAPDCGQRGLAWAFYASANSTLPVVLGAAIALLPCTYLNRTAPDTIASAALLGTAMLLVHAFDRALTPGGYRTRSTPSPEDDGDGDGGSALRSPDLLLT
jgi:hypothetical protein